MILPILRLALIYFLLVAAVVAVFNRDKLAQFLPAPRERAEIAPAPPAPLAEVPEFEAAPAAQPATDAPAPADPATADEAPSYAPSEPVTPAPGIAPPMPPLRDSSTPPEPLAEADPVAEPTPSGGADAADDGTHVEYPPPDEPAAPAALATPAPGSSQPATPGAPAPLGTPVAVEAPTADPQPADPQPAQPAGTALQAPAPQAPAPQAPSQPGGHAAAVADASLGEAIANARALYWTGDIEGARAAMQTLATDHPDEPDVLGELGNLAFALRDYPAAAEDWYQAGLLLIERGENARVMAFLPILQSIDPQKAAGLAAKLPGR